MTVVGDGWLIAGVRPGGHDLSGPPALIVGGLMARWRQLQKLYSDRIRSRPTEYRGVMMRSRLEADFAYHLDNQQAEWRYEPLIFGPVGRGYMPDFEVKRPDGLHYIEVKATLGEAPLAKKRMEVIWRDYPDAVLVVACAEECRFFAATVGQEWFTWVDRWAHQ